MPRRVLAFIVSSCLSVFLIACGPPPGGAGNWMGPGGPPGGPGGGQPAGPAACNKSQCAEYCSDVRCIGEGDDLTGCTSQCEARCGDGYFDDKDQSVIDCVIKAGPSLECGNKSTCCGEYFTSQLCN